MPPSVEAIERATLAALPPDAMEELDGWLLALDRGTVGRARSAVPLAHGATPHAALLPRIEAIEARYRAHELAPMFRLPMVPAFAPFGDALRSRGYVQAKPTLVMLGRTERMAQMADPQGVELADRPTPAWERLYLGEISDPADGASRVRLLRRAEGAAYASLSAPAPAGPLAQNGRGALAGEQGAAIAAVGCACFSQGLLGVHGMRTRAAWRGRGLARQLLAAMGREARRRGIALAFLQVEAGNEPARALYARCGFEPAWTYAYWRVG